MGWFGGRRGWGLRGGLGWFLGLDWCFSGLLWFGMVIFRYKQERN